MPASSTLAYSSRALAHCRKPAAGVAQLDPERNVAGPRPRRLRVGGFRLAGLAPFVVVAEPFEQHLEVIRPELDRGRMLLGRPVPPAVGGERPEGRDRDVGVLGPEVLHHGEVGFGLRPAFRAGLEPECLQADRIRVRCQPDGVGVFGGGLIRPLQRREGPPADDPPARVVRQRGLLDQSMRLGVVDQVFHPVVPVLPGNQSLIVKRLLSVPIELPAGVLQLLPGRVGLTGMVQSHGQDGIVEGPGVKAGPGQRLAEIEDRLLIPAGAVVAEPPDIVSDPEDRVREVLDCVEACALVVVRDGVRNQGAGAAQLAVDIPVARRAEPLEHLLAKPPVSGFVALEEEQQGVFVPGRKTFRRPAVEGPGMVAHGEVPQAHPGIERAPLDQNLRMVRAEVDGAVVSGLGSGPLAEHGVLPGEVDRGTGRIHSLGAFLNLPGLGLGIASRQVGIGTGGASARHFQVTRSRPTTSSSANPVAVSTAARLRGRSCGADTRPTRAWPRPPRRSSSAARLSPVRRPSRSAVPILLQAAHDDPVELAAHEFREPCRVRPAPCRHRGQGGPERGQPRTRLRRVFLLEDSPDLVEGGLLEPLLVERGGSGEQFVEQHAEGIHVAARVHVELVDFGLLGAHVERRADHLGESRVDRLLGELLAEGLGHAEVDDLDHRHAVMRGDQDVRGLQVAMDHALLVRMPHRLAHLEEQPEPFPGTSGGSRRNTR